MFCHCNIPCGKSEIYLRFVSINMVLAYIEILWCELQTINSLYRSIIVGAGFFYFCPILITNLFIFELWRIYKRKKSNKNVFGTCSYDTKTREDNDYRQQYTSLFYHAGVSERRHQPALAAALFALTGCLHTPEKLVLASTQLPVAM